MEVKINREIRNYTESMFFGLSLRQLVFSALAVAVAVGLYFLLKPCVGVVQRGRFKAQFPGFQHLRAQPRPNKLLRRHAVVGEEAQGGKGGRAHNAHPGHGFRADVGFQQKVHLANVESCLKYDAI
mgnify:CR=1 FL=1